MTTTTKTTLVTSTATPRVLPDLTQVAPLDTALASVPAGEPLVSIDITSNMPDVTQWGADMYRQATLQGEEETGPLFMSTAHSDVMDKLVDLLTRARATALRHPENDDYSVRGAMLRFWYATPAGIAHAKRKASLPQSHKLRSPQQRATWDTYKDVENNINVKMQRMIDVHRGIELLRDAGREVDIMKMPGTKTYVCFVQLPKPLEVASQSVEFSLNDLQRMLLLDPAVFAKDARKDDEGKPCYVATTNLVELAIVTDKAAKAKAKAAATAATDAANAAANAGRQDAPAENKGGTAAIGLEASEVGAAAKVLDTAIARFADDDKGGVTLSNDTTDDLLLLWARLDATLTAKQKAKARKMFASEGEVSVPAVKKIAAKAK